MSGTLLLTGCNNKETAPVVSWVVMEEGLSKVDSTLGQGATCGTDDFVEVHYTGWLWEADENGVLGKGNQFDSSVERGTPIAFPLGMSMVIPGWDKGLVGMNVGGKRSLLIEPAMGYGPAGRPPVIPANATLFFDVELVSLPKVDIEILEEGDGAIAELGDKVSMNYTGWLWENGEKGTQFDSSTNTGRPFQFTLGAGQVIAGWDRGIEGMKIGQKTRLIIPSVMGYGARGSGGRIPPNATLCFDVELVSIEGK
ncbi:MAG: FKBP-type peptidyl-prolyl cis-trans isomerase [bacterium]|nr:FKBP-type peptidyl-prolyl cis-trans isomerase [bacterium]